MKDERFMTMVATTAVVVAVAAFLTAPAHAVPAMPDGDGGSTASAVVSTGLPGPIPYLSHGIGVDHSLFSGERSLGLTGDSPLGRVAAPEPEGLTGDSALTRVETPAAATTSGAASETDWAWVGIGSGAGALFLAAIGAIAFTTRQRGRVAMP